MKYFLIGCALLLMSANLVSAAPVVYTDEALFLAGLATREGSTLHESFEDEGTWADSRTPISNPGSTRS